jgi:hypothetical protein
MAGKPGGVKARFALATLRGRQLAAGLVARKGTLRT